MLLGDTVTKVRKPKKFDLVNQTISPRERVGSGDETTLYAVYIMSHDLQPIRWLGLMFVASFQDLPWLQFFLQYAKIEREGLGYLIFYDDIRWTEGRPTGGSVQLL